MDQPKKLSFIKFKSLVLYYEYLIKYEEEPKIIKMSAN